MNTSIQIPDWYRDPKIPIDERISSFLRYQRNKMTLLKLWYKRATEQVIENRDLGLIHKCNQVIASSDMKLSYHDEEMLDILVDSHQKLVSEIVGKIRSTTKK